MPHIGRVVPVLSALTLKTWPLSLWYMAIFFSKVSGRFPNLDSDLPFHPAKMHDLQVTLVDGLRYHTLPRHVEMSPGWLGQ